MEIDYDLKNKRKMCLAGIYWMAFPIIIIVLAFYTIINYPSAVLIVTTFHFGAMYYLIKRMNYLIKK